MSYYGTPNENLHNERGLRMQCWEIRKALGLNENKLPSHAVAPCFVGNIIVWLRSAEGARKIQPNSKRPHRMMTACPVCEKIVSAGKFQQHIRIHAEA